jgi:hypothetical protein
VQYTVQGSTLVSGGVGSMLKDYYYCYYYYYYYFRFSNTIFFTDLVYITTVGPKKKKNTKIFTTAMFVFVDFILNL